MTRREAELVLGLPIPRMSRKCCRVVVVVPRVTVVVEVSWVEEVREVHQVGWVDEVRLGNAAWGFPKSDHRIQQFFQNGRDSSKCKAIGQVRVECQRANSEVGRRGLRTVLLRCFVFPEISMCAVKCSRSNLTAVQLLSINYGSYSTRQTCRSEKLAETSPSPEVWMKTPMVPLKNCESVTLNR